MATGGTDGIGRALAATATAVAHLRRSGEPVTQAVAQILPFLDAPPARLTAVLDLWSSGRQGAAGGGWGKGCAPCGRRPSKMMAR
jgi:hypothetical protein